MSNEILTREQVGLAFGELDMYLKELTSHSANKKRHVSLRISEIARKSHFATLNALDAALERERVAVDALKRVEDIYSFWLESGDSTTAMDELVYTNEVVVEALGDRSDYATPLVLPQDDE